MWGRIPEKERSNWKKDFKRRLGRGDGNNNSSNNDGNSGNDPIHQPDNGQGGNPYDYQTLGDLPQEDPESKPGMFGKFFGAKKNN